MPVLSDTKIRGLKPADKAFKLYDTGGLFLLVNPAGGRWWRFKYHFAGKERGLSLGTYPDISLKDARGRRDEARSLVAKGIDPSLHRQTEREARTNTFKLIAQEWLASQESRLAPITLEKARWMLETFVYPRLGSRPIAEITAQELLRTLREIEKRGILETAHRTKQRCGQIFRYAIVTGRAERDITLDLRGALAPVKTQNRAAVIEPQKIGALLRAIDGYDGYSVTAIALKLSALLFVRPGELRGAEWSEIDLDAGEWRIPRTRMKMGERHIVPLATQAVELFRRLKETARKSRYAFPSLRTAERPISNNTVTAALRRLGYTGEEMTAHGFRAMASTCLNELGWHPDLIELQLAHAERNKVRAAYNRSERLAERRKMMQAWADHLVRLKEVS